MNEIMDCITVAVIIAGIITAIFIIWVILSKSEPGECLWDLP